MRPNQVRGEQHGRSLLTADEVREIRRRFAAGGVTKVELADEFDISATTIRHIVIGRTWRHLLSDGGGEPPR